MIKSLTTFALYVTASSHMFDMMHRDMGPICFLKLHSQMSFVVFCGHMDAATANGASVWPSADGQS